MADFTLIKMDLNDGILGAPVWVPIGGANTEVRWCDVNSAKDTAVAAWPAMIRPAATAPVRYTYAYSAAATGNGVGSTSGANPCPAFTEALYLFARWNWDNTGTFASGPIWTAYPTNAHGAVTPDDGTLLGGKVADTGGAGYSYLKGNAYGRDDGAGAPAAAPAAAPVVTDGTVGVVSPGAGANWIANFQDLQGDNDWILAPFTPTATSADTWSLEFALFTGPNMIPALYVIVMTLKYTWT
jgi:hypothetical protein